MTIQTTIIPSRIDASAVDGEYIDVTDEDKITSGKRYFSQLANQEIEIIELQANATLSPLDAGTLLADTFIDADGYTDTVDTGSSTATFDTNKYKSQAIGDTINGAALPTNDGTNTNAKGLRILTTAAINLTSVTKNANVTATKCHLRANDDSPIQSATFVGNVATFNAALDDATYYKLMIDSDGGSYTGYRATGLSVYPIVGTSLNITDGVSVSVPDATTAYNIASLITSSNLESYEVVIDLPTITGTVIGTLLVANTPDREDGDAVQYSITDGVTTDADLVLDEKNDGLAYTLDSAPTQLILNLLPKETSPTEGVPSVKSYCLVLLKS